jgi:leucyl aminopeptidase
VNVKGAAGMSLDETLLKHTAPRRERPSARLSSAGMKGMKGDMAGAGAALGAAIALKRLGALPDGLPPHLADRPLECYLAITDNLIGPKAFRPDDVHVACDGTTIEMVHTDAEGRLALADTLALASRKVNWPCAPPSDGETDAEAAVLPALVIDMATLTGTMVTALSKRYSGVFSSRMHSHPATMGAIVAAGVASGERLWYDRHPPTEHK